MNENKRKLHNHVCYRTLQTLFNIWNHYPIAFGMLENTAPIAGAREKTTTPRIGKIICLRIVQMKWFQLYLYMLPEVPSKFIHWSAVLTVTMLKFLSYITYHISPCIRSSSGKTKRWYMFAIRNIGGDNLKIDLAYMWETIL